MICPDLPPKVREAIEALRADGIEPDAREVVWLCDLRRRCDSPSDGSVGWVMGAPVMVGDHTFWPLHRLAESWFIRAYRLAEEHDINTTALFLFAHVHSGLGDTSLRLLTSGDAIASEVSRWWDECGIHEEMMPLIVKRLTELDGDAMTVPSPNQQDDVDDGSKHTFIAMMQRLYPGVSPEYWMTEIPAADARDIAECITASGEWAMSGKRTRAIMSFLNAIKWIRQAHSER